MLRRCRWFSFFGAAVGSLRAFAERSLAGVLVGDPAVPRTTLRRAPQCIYTIFVSAGWSTGTTP